MVVPTVPACDTPVVPPQLAAPDGGMDVDMIAASDFDGRGTGRQRSPDKLPTTPIAMPVREDAQRSDDVAMGRLRMISKG